MKKCKSNGTWTKNNGPEFLGGYEHVNESGSSTAPYIRKFTLVRIPKRGPVKKKTLYFTSPRDAINKGWVLS